jgi:hypothetical protein
MVTIRETVDSGEEEETEVNNEENGDQLNEDQQSGVGYHITAREMAAASTRRDTITDAMWAQFLQHKASRG